MLNSNKKLKVLAAIISIMLILLIVGIEMLKLKGYYLIYDWMYFIIIYVILFLSILLSSKNKYLNWAKYAAILIIFIFSTKGLLGVSKNKIFIFKSPNLKNEIIIKEIVEKKGGTVKILDIKRRFYLFAKEVSKYPTEKAYRSFSSGAYKVKWIKDNIAVVNYLYSNKGKDIKQHVYTFNFKEPISYNYVVASLKGEWRDKENPNNTLTAEKNKFVYVKNGKTYEYDITNAEQRGYTAVILKGQGKAPDLSIVFNEGNTIDSTCLLNKEATIFVGNVSLEDEKYGLFKKTD